MSKTIWGGLLLAVSLGTSVHAACPTYVFTNGSTADANQINSNFACIFVSPSFTGNVGIGTSSPILPLQVSGTANTPTNSGSTQNGMMFVGGPGGNGLFTGILAGSPYTAWMQAGFDVPSANAWYPISLNPLGGNVGIGTLTPSYLLTVNGTAYASGAQGALSDLRDKDKVTTLPAGALGLVEKLRPVSFVWKDPKDDGMRGQQMGFIAQEVEKVLPSVVLTQKDDRKTKGLKYNEIIAVLTKAIQEQQAEIVQLRAAVAELKPALAALRADRSTEKAGQTDQKMLVRAAAAD